MANLNPPVNEKDHLAGNDDARVTLVEYGDYECPHCRHAHPIVKRIRKHFGEQLRFAFRNFPLVEMHPHAESAAETAEFAGTQDKFWEMHDELFENQERLGEPLYLELADKLSLPSARLKETLEQRRFKDRIRADFSSGVRSGVNGTPTFFINGSRHDGPFEYGDLAPAIQHAIDGAKEASGRRG